MQICSLSNFIDKRYENRYFNRYHRSSNAITLSKPSYISDQFPQVIANVFTYLTVKETPKMCNSDETIACSAILEQSY